MEIDLNGMWESNDYECPWGVKHLEVVEIKHLGDEVVAVKITGDECVPAGFESFSGRLPAGTPVGAITWTAGYPRAPASGRVPGFLRVIDQDRFVAGYESGGDYVFRRKRDTLNPL